LKTARFKRPEHLGSREGGGASSSSLAATCVDPPPYGPRGTDGAPGPQATGGWRWRPTGRRNCWRPCSPPSPPRRPPAGRRPAGPGPHQGHRPAALLPHFSSALLLALKGGGRAPAGRHASSRPPGPGPSPPTANPKGRGWRCRTPTDGRRPMGFRFQRGFPLFIRSFFKCPLCGTGRRVWS